MGDRPQLGEMLRGVAADVRETLEFLVPLVLLRGSGSQKKVVHRLGQVEEIGPPDPVDLGEGMAGKADGIVTPH